MKKAFLTTSLLLAGLCAGASAGQPEGPEDELVALCRRIRQNVVAITAVAAETEGLRDGRARFSGVLIDRKGHVVTLADILPPEADLWVRFLDGAQRRATLVATDRFTNIGVLRVEDAAGTPVLPPPPETPPVGTRVVAVGNPFGLYHSVAEGIVSGTDRTLRGHGQGLVRGMIQTTAPINPGDAGGLLADREGRFVGMISSTFGRAPSFHRIRRMMGEMFRRMNQDPEFKALVDEIGRLFFQGLAGQGSEELQKKLEELGERLDRELPWEKEGEGPGKEGALFGAQAINFAVPGDQVLDIARRLIRDGKVIRGRLGARALTLQGDSYHRQKFEIPKGIDGALVVDIDAGGPAADAGLKRFDVIRAFQDQPVLSSSDLMDRVLTTPPGTRVTLRVWRRDEGDLTVEAVVASLD